MPRLTRGPDFIMLGQPQGDEKVIVASTSLYQASFLSECDIEYYEEDPWGPPSPYRKARPVNERHTIEAVMRDVTVARGPDYPIALARLLQTWTPTPGDQPALPPGRSQ